MQSLRRRTVRGTGSPLSSVMDGGVVIRSTVRRVIVDQIKMKPKQVRIYTVCCTAAPTAATCADKTPTWWESASVALGGNHRQVMTCTAVRYFSSAARCVFARQMFFFFFALCLPDRVRCVLGEYLYLVFFSITSPSQVLSGHGRAEPQPTAVALPDINYLFISDPENSKNLWASWMLTGRTLRLWYAPDGYVCRWCQSHQQAL